MAHTLVDHIYKTFTLLIDVEVIRNGVIVGNINILPAIPIQI